MMNLLKSKDMNAARKVSTQLVIKAAAFIAFLCAFSASAAARYSMTLTITNLPVTSNTLVFSAPISKTITWTNNTTSTFVTTNTSIGGATTNLFLHFAAYSIGTPRLIPELSSSNIIRLTGENDQLITAIATNNGLWVSISYSTSTVSQAVAVTVQQGGIAGIGTTNTPQWIASQAIKGFSDSSTNSFSQTAISMSNFISLAQSQTFGNKTETNSTFKSGVVTNSAAYITNGLQSDSIYLRPTLTNAVNYGNAFRSPGLTGLGGGSTQIGDNAQANSDRTTAIGTDSLATNNAANAFGYQAKALFSDALAFGTASVASNTSALAFGNGAWALGVNSLAVGTDAHALSDNTIAFGTSSATTTSNQIRVGSSTHTVSVPGVLQATAISNLVVSTGTNTFGGDIAFGARVNTTLANGNNSGILLGSNVVLRLCGPTGAYTNAGFLAEREGSFHILQLTNPAITMTILNESGLDATPANRILTGTGADMTFTNNPVHLQILYDGAAARWRLLNWTK